MVFLLAGDILADTFYLRLADRKRSVTALPVETFYAVLLHPLRAITFDVADKLADVHSANGDQKVYVIRDPARDDHPSFVVLNNPGDVGVEARLHLFGNQRTAVLGREYDVDEDLDY